MKNSVLEAISSLYTQIFQNKTRKSGPIIIGYDNQDIVEQLQEGVTFYPFIFYLEKIKIWIS